MTSMLVPPDRKLLVIPARLRGVLNVHLAARRKWNCPGDAMIGCHDISQTGVSTP
jgi:hypothetical protein